jgi:hypothetical protein
LFIVKGENVGEMTLWGFPVSIGFFFLPLLWKLDYRTLLLNFFIIVIFITQMKYGTINLYCLYRLFYF